MYFCTFALSCSPYLSSYAFFFLSTASRGDSFSTCSSTSSVLNHRRATETGRTARRGKTILDEEASGERRENDMLVVGQEVDGQVFRAVVGGFRLFDPP